MSTVSQIQLRTDTAAAWTSANPILRSGEVGIESDTRRLKVGNGTSTWSALSYFISGIHTRGQASRTTVGTVSIATQGTYVSTGLAATFDSTTAYGTTLGTTDQFAVKNTSGSTQLFNVSASVDVHAGNNQNLGLRLSKNGVGIAESEVRSLSGSDAVSLSTSWLISAAANDEIGIQVANHDGTTAISLKRGRIVLTGISL